jgi:RNA polymerase sigma-70 factor (ECF subfamily)
MTTDAGRRSAESTDASLAAVLARQHRRFLAFLANRVGSHAVAEDILQNAYAKAIERGSQLRNEESAVAWFYRILRNVASTLKPAYAAILNDVDVEGLSVEESARRAGISANNGSVRVHRARKALALRLAEVGGVCTTHQCVDCDCRHEGAKR